MSRRRAGLAMLALASALALAGCAAPGPSGGSPVPTAEPGLRTPLFPVTARELLEYCPAAAAEHFDGVAAAVIDIYLCSSSDILSVDGGDGDGGDGTGGAGALPSVQRASRVVGGGDALLAAYALPNAPATTGACIQLAADPLIVWLSTEAGIVPVYAPVDECGFPTSAATEAFNAVELDTILEIRADGPAPTDPAD